MSLFWCFRITCRLTLSERPIYPQDSIGHCAVACFPWLLNAPNVDYDIDYCLMESSSDYGKFSWGSCRMARPGGPGRSGLTIELDIQMNGYLTYHRLSIET